MIENKVFSYLYGGGFPKAKNLKFMKLKMKKSKRIEK